jgi:hypothetical protein
MLSIYEAVRAKATSARWYEDEMQREPFLLEAFFNEVKQLGTDLEFLKGKKPNVRPLDLSAFDVKALPLDRGTFEKLQVSLPFFKNQLAINEKLRQELLKVIATGNELYINAIVDKIYDDNKVLLEDAAITREVMRAQLMTTGAISFASNGQEMSYDFGVPEANKISRTGDNAWSASATADPIADIIAWQDQVQSATGVRPSNLLMNRFTFNLLKKCATVKNALFYPVNGAARNVYGDSAIKSLISEETGCTVYIYDKGYYPQGSNSLTKFVPDYVVVLFPEGALGNFVFGTTPEEADLMSGSDAEVEIVDLGVALTTIKEKDPVNVMTKVSMIGVPTLEKPEEMVIASVGTAG